MTALDTIDTVLLGASDGPAVEIVNPAAAGRFVIACEHAARRIPAALGALGLEAAALTSHIAWDPGALALSTRLAGLLAAPVVAARFSRLVCDVNRPPDAPDAMPAVSEIHQVPGNRILSAADRQARAGALYQPFHAALADLLDARARAGAVPALVTVHSFTPVWFGRPRAVEIGVLHDADARLADGLLAHLATPAAADGLTLARNQPYGPADGVTHTLKRHALARGLPNVMLELRSDRIADGDGVARVADLLAPALVAALDGLEG